MRTKKTLKLYFHFQTSTIHNILKGQHNCVFFCIPCWFLTEGSQVTLFHGTHSTLSIQRLFQTKWRMKLSVYLFIYLFSQFVQLLLLWFFFRLLHYVLLLHPWSDGATKSPTCARLSVKTMSSQARLIYSCWFVFLSVNLFFFNISDLRSQEFPLLLKKYPSAGGGNFKEMSNKRKHDSFI